MAIFPHVWPFFITLFRSTRAAWNTSVSLLVRLCARKKSLDHFIYRHICLIRRLIKPTRWPQGIQLHNIYKRSQKKTSLKSCLNFNFIILTKPCAQSLSKSLAFWPNLSFEICNKLLPTRSSSAAVTTSTSFELASSHARVTSIKFTKQESVSQLVS